jgi:hypothetical protein
MTQVLLKKLNNNLVLSFFRYCQVRFSPNQQVSSNVEALVSAPARQAVSRVVVYPNGQKVEEEVDLITDFSWRNFFSSINFVKVMQKLTKRRPHRIWLLVQYKSSVGSKVLSSFIQV